MSSLVLAASRVFAGRSGPVSLVAPPMRRVALAGATQASAAVLVLVLLHTGGTAAAFPVGHGAASATATADLPPLVHWLRDAALAAPLAIVTLAAATLLTQLVVRRGRLDARSGRTGALWAGLGALCFAVAMIPAGYLHGQLFGEIHPGVAPLAHGVSEAAVAALPAFLVLLAIARFAGLPWSAGTQGGWTLERTVKFGLPAAAAGLILGFAAVSGGAAEAKQTQVAAQTRTYYIAADEVAWDYAPSGATRSPGSRSTTTENVFIAARRRSHRHASTARRSTASTPTRRSSTLKPRAAADEHLGLLGPVIRAEVGDTIKVVFKNNTRVPGQHAPARRLLRQGRPRARRTTTAPAAPTRRDDAVAARRHATPTRWDGARARRPGPDGRQLGDLDVPLARRRGRATPTPA